MQSGNRCFWRLFQSRVCLDVNTIYLDWIVRCFYYFGHDDKSLAIHDRWVQRTYIDDHSWGDVLQYDTNIGLCGIKGSYNSFRFEISSMYVEKERLYHGYFIFGMRLPLLDLNWTKTIYETDTLVICGFCHCTFLLLNLLNLLYQQQWVSKANG